MSGFQFNEFASAVRAGEHACCRLPHAEDRERLAFAYVRDGLRRGNKVVYFCDTAGLIARLRLVEPDVDGALARGQLEVCPAENVYAPGGIFDVDTTLAKVRDHVERSRAQGYPGIYVAGEMGWALVASTTDRLAEYERRLAELMDGGGVVIFCQYDHARFTTGALADVTDAHQVDVSPDLAAIGRDGRLAAAHVGPSGTLRLAGDLDFGCADALASVLAHHYHGHLHLDLADIDFVDVTGMRAMRGRTDQPLTIVAASPAVRRLADLLGWDTDPDIQIAA